MAVPQICVLPHYHLKSSDNVRTSGDHLQRTPGVAEKFYLATWTADADASINVVLMVPEAEWLSLCIDINFTPDRLRRLFHKHAELALSFSPISSLVSFTTPHSEYRRFIHTRYDSVLENLTRWPSAELPAISVVEDLVDDPTGWPTQPLRPRLLAAPRSHPRAPPARPGARDRPHPAPQPLKVGPLPHYLPRPLHFPLYRSRREKTPPLPLPCLRHLVIDLCNLFDDARTRATGPPLRITVCSRAKTLTLVNRRSAALPTRKDHVRDERSTVSSGYMIVDDGDEFAQSTEVRDAEDCPVVCLAGQKGRKEDIEYAEGCDHSVRWDIWEDTL
ncbi:hypothetical protein EDB92DRAFT_2117216 [Lactarius akahatsu]|uniref:Uncharacterized protein n=1 Tax=Lactarius akahatsu TaxID=416441 RepID=A0AAD4LAM9_9AGAM|nr:hypothetical protein EDB92DRAFT_2117216 [Lactarius akahatsu]